MKLSHVSVLRGLGTEEGKDYCIRAVMEEQPPLSWTKLFQLTWLISPAFRKLCSDIQFNRNEVLLFVKDADKISETIEAIKNALVIVDTQLQGVEVIPVSDFNEAAM